MLLDRWFVCKQRIFLSCDVVKVQGYYHGIFNATLISKLLKRVFMKQKPQNLSQNAMKCNAIPRHSFRCDVTDVNNTVSVGNTITANTELPGVMRVTPAWVTLEVVGEPTMVSQRKFDVINKWCHAEVNQAYRTCAFIKFMFGVTFCFEMLPNINKFRNKILNFFQQVSRMWL